MRSCKVLLIFAVALMVIAPGTTQAQQVDFCLSMEPIDPDPGGSVTFYLTLDGVSVYPAPSTNPICIQTAGENCFGEIGENGEIEFTGWDAAWEATATFAGVWTMGLFEETGTDPTSHADGRQWSTTDDADIAALAAGDTVCKLVDPIDGFEGGDEGEGEG